MSNSIRRETLEAKFHPGETVRYFNDDAVVLCVSFYAEGEPEYEIYIPADENQWHEAKESQLRSLIEEEK